MIPECNTKKSIFSLIKSGHSSEETLIEPNARLIAAAPEMLEALLYVANDDGCPDDVANIVLAAIAKARGLK